MSELKTYHRYSPSLIGLADYYLKSEAEAVFAAQDAKIAELKKERDWLAKDRAQAYDDLERHAQLNIQKDAEIARLKEDALNTDKAREKWLQLARKQAKEICRLKRALYKACAMWAKSERYTEATWHGDEHREELWAGVEERCRAMVDKFKGVQNDALRC